MSAAPAAKLDGDLLRLISSLIEDRLGLRFNEANYDLLEAGLLRVAAARRRRIADLLQQLLLPGPSDELLQAVVQGITICETYFFRHPEHFELVQRDVVPAVLRSGRSRMRALSIGCSTGEEAYSLSMTLSSLGLSDVAVLGCDVNRAALEQAERGRYGRRSLRVGSPLLDRYLRPTSDSGVYTVEPELKKITQFRYLNLGSPTALPALGTSDGYDVIFCRNVLVYFAPRHLLRVIEQLRDLLSPCGYLVLSALDVPESVPGLERVILSGVPVLRRKSARPASTQAAVLQLSAMAESSAPASSPGSVLTASPTTDLGPRLSAAVPQPLRDEGAVPQGLDRMSSAPYRDAAVALLSAAKDAADAGKLARAMEEVRSALALRRSPEALHLQALILNELGERSAAEKALLEAVEQDPDYVLAHLSLGLIERPKGQRWLSGRHLGAVLHLVQSRREDETLPGPEPLSVGHARRLAAVALSALLQKAASEESLPSDAGPALRGGGAR
jgi:chemotaxis protein methyltransferase CheR